MFPEGQAIVRSANRETSHVDRRDPLGLGVDHQCAGSQRDSIGDAAVLAVKPLQPLLRPQCIGKRPVAELYHNEGEGAAEQG